MLPEVAVNVPRSIWIEVVLPDPLGPRNPRISLSFSSKEISLTAMVGGLPGKILLSFLTERTVVGVFIEMILLFE